MADVSKIQGPSGPSESAGKKDKAAADADKFKQAMNKRVTEVSAVDPDEQKKRKRREEDEEENIDQLPAVPPPPTTPFSLENASKGVRPLDMQKEGQGISPIHPSSDLTHKAHPEALKAQKTEGTSFGDKSEGASESDPGNRPPTAPSDQSHSRNEDTSDSEENIPSTPPNDIQPINNDRPSPQETNLSESEQESTSLTPTDQKHAQREDLSTQEKFKIKKTKTEKFEDTAGFFKQFKSSNNEEMENKTSIDMPEEIEEIPIFDEDGTLAAPLIPSQIVDDKENKKIESNEKGVQTEIIGLSIPQAELPLVAEISPPPLESLPPYAKLSSQVMDLYDRMVGMITVMTASGVSETSVTLNMPQFASSVFFGTQIIIQEYTTAPKAFNVQLNGTPQAVALFEGSVNDLMAAFQSSNYNYRINRIDTGYLQDKPLFKRKEKTDNKDKETGENS